MKNIGQHNSLPKRNMREFFTHSEQDVNIKIHIFTYDTHVFLRASLMSVAHVFRD